MKLTKTDKGGNIYWHTPDGILKKVEYADGMVEWFRNNATTKKVKNRNGTIEWLRKGGWAIKKRKYLDGRIELYRKDGTLKKIKTPVEVLAPNKFKYKVEWYNKEGNLKKVKYPSGETHWYNKDGTKSIKYANGVVIWTTSIDTIALPGENEKPSKE